MNILIDAPSCMNSATTKASLPGLVLFDAAPLIDAETTSSLIAGKRRHLYRHADTDYDERRDGSSRALPVVKWRYKSNRTTVYSYWLGMEDSPVIWQNHLIVADNGGNLMCLNLNTLKLDWVQDILDDSNSTPVLELENGHPYIYVSTSFTQLACPENGSATVPIWKIDAENGEIVWQTDYQCRTVSGVSGGVQGTIAVGKNNLSNLIFVPVARTSQGGAAAGSTGVLAALDKETGEVVWEIETQMYSWSSPTICYDDNGDGYIIYCTSGYYIYLLDGRTGDKLDSMNIGGNIEASPAVFGNYVVVGHRAQAIYGIELK